MQPTKSTRRAFMLALHPWNLAMHLKMLTQRLVLHIIPMPCNTYEMY